MYDAQSCHTLGVVAKRLTISDVTCEQVLLDEHDEVASAQGIPGSLGSLPHAVLTPKPSSGLAKASN